MPKATTTSEVTVMLTLSQTEAETLQKLLSCETWPRSTEDSGSNYANALKAEEQLNAIHATLFDRAVSEGAAKRELLMAKITERKPTDREFVFTVSEQELQFIARGLVNDHTNSDENSTLYGTITGYMDDNGIDEL